MPNPTTLAAWKKLATLAATNTVSPAKDSPLSITAAGLMADFSRQTLNAEVLSALMELCVQQGLEAKRDAMFAGEPINLSENRAVLHTALRGGALPHAERDAAVTATLAQMRAFTQDVRGGRIRGASDQKFSDVVSIGIGGSALGPQLAVAAVGPQSSGPKLHFVSNIDGAHLADVLHGLNPATTLFLITSKTFTTDETMTNARSARAWIDSKLGDGSAEKHLVAITTNSAEAMRAGFTPERIFVFWDWVGGRYSLWSAVGLPLALAAGYDAFDAMLQGARAMDQHFCEAPLENNLPVVLGAIGVWYRNFHNMTSHAVLPYAQRIALLPKYLQQLEMESNGKSVDNGGQRVNYSTCPVIFGEPGTDGQHSFHQLLHQGSDRISSDIILVANPPTALSGHHAKLLANGIAQADALWQGNESSVAQKRHEGNRPVTILVLPTLDAFHFGALVALYEHKVFVQGVLWNINSFDQWGVELGKVLAKSLIGPIENSALEPPPHLRTLISHLHTLQAAQRNH